MALNHAGSVSRLVTTRAGLDECNPAVAAYQRRGPERAFYAPGLFRNAGALVADSDVVHGHGFYVATNWVLGREARRRRKPLVYHAHGIFEPWILARSRGKKRIAHWLFEDANFKYAKLWRALTSKEADQIRAQGISAPVVVCPNGIDLDTFTRIPELRDRGRQSKQTRRLLFLARLHPKKGLDLLMQAWAALPPQKRQAWRLIIAGPDELGHRGEIEAMVRRLQLTGEVEFAGPVSGEEKLRRLAEADAFVLPSRSEGFSVAILEAMACRLPVLATDACNFPALEAEGGGWLVEATVGGIHGGLDALISAGEAELTQRGLRGRALVEKDYTWPGIAERLAMECERIVQ